MANCTGIMGTLITLDQAVDFEAMDDEPVSTLFILIVPEKAMDAHIEVLSMIVEKFQHPSFRERVDAARNPDDLYLAAISDVV
jgi:PTS system nitrogen regulatory IIA component